jgi:hypothetical protein
MMHWIFLMITAQLCILLALLAVLVDIKRTLRVLDDHLGMGFHMLEKRLPQLTGSAPGKGGGRYE